MQSQRSGSGCAKQVLSVCSGPGMAVLLLLLQTPLPILLHVGFYVIKFEFFRKKFAPKNTCNFISFNRKTSDVPEQYREEGEMVVPSYGYFIRGAQTSFSGVLRFVAEKISVTSADFANKEGKVIYIRICTVYKIIHEIFCILFQRPTVEVHPVQNDRL